MGYSYVRQWVEIARLRCPESNGFLANERAAGQVEGCRSLWNGRATTVGYQPPPSKFGEGAGPFPPPAGDRNRRLDAPGNEFWTEGDQLQASVSVPAEGALLEKLPAGRYRLCCPAQRYPSDDPEPFDVAGAETRISLPLPMPRSFRVTLIVRDGSGHPLERGRPFGWADRSQSRGDPISWLRRREVRDPARFSSAAMGGGFGGRLSSAHKGGPKQAIGGQFDLGTFLESDRRTEDSAYGGWRDEGRTEVNVRVIQDGAEDRTYVAVSLPLETIRSSLILPEGARIEAWCDAVLLPPGALPPPLEVQVQVTCEGYESLEFAVRPGEAIPVRSMTAE